MLFFLGAKQEEFEEVPLHGLLSVGSTDELSDANERFARKQKRPRRSLKGSDKPTNLSFYSGEAKDILNLTKEILKLKIFTRNAYPDIEETNEMIKSSYGEAVESLDVPEESDLGMGRLALVWSRLADWFDCP